MHSEQLGTLILNGETLRGINSLTDIFRSFDDPEECVAVFEKLCWPWLLECEHCQTHKQIYKLSKKDYHFCGECGGGFMLREEDVFENSDISVRHWLAANFLETSYPMRENKYVLARELNISPESAVVLITRIHKVCDKLIHMTT